MRLLKISILNKIYLKHANKKDLDFIDGLLEEFKIKFEIPKEDLARLPKDGVIYNSF